MVSGAENVNFFTFKGYPNVNPIKTGVTPAKEVTTQGVNYAKYDGNKQPNFAQFDYRPPVVGGDGVHGLKCNYFA
mgnify:FL=1